MSLNSLEDFPPPPPLMSRRSKKKTVWKREKKVLAVKINYEWTTCWQTQPLRSTEHHCTFISLETKTHFFADDVWQKNKKIFMATMIWCFCSLNFYFNWCFSSGIKSEPLFCANWLVLKLTKLLINEFGLVMFSVFVFLKLWSTFNKV